jgi:hypothetical protein
MRCWLARSVVLRAARIARTAAWSIDPDAAGAAASI